MNVNRVATVFLRYALAASYLSAVADRFGLWGNAGDPGVVWGNFNSFLEYTQFLNPWASASISNFLGYLATGAEVILALLFMSGVKLKLTSLASFSLLMIFALSMTFTSGIKGAFDYSVFTAAAGSLLLFAQSKARE